MTDTQSPTALVIGATGGVGGAVAERLLAAGWRVRALNRDPKAVVGRYPQLAGVEWIRGDAMRVHDVTAAARGAQLIVHGVNPAGYRNWAELAMPMLHSTIAAAKAEGARILFPGTVYNFSPEDFPALTEDTPQRPTTRKGRIRVAMEQALAAAAQDGARVLIVRAGDFLGPRAGNSWFSQALVKPGQPLTAVTYPGPVGLTHPWAYLPDLAETMVRLVEREDELADFEVFHFRGHQLPGVDMMDALDRIAGRPLTRRSLPWRAFKAMAPFNETLREMLEVRYLWRRPHVLANGKLAAVLGEEPHTPLDAALRATLAGLKIETGEGAAKAPRRSSRGAVALG